MSYVEWQTTEGRQEARGSGKPWRWIRTYEASSVAGSEPIMEFYQIGIEKCTHNDGLVCGRTREQHPAICPCWDKPDGHEFR